MYSEVKTVCLPSYCIARLLINTDCNIFQQDIYDQTTADVNLESCYPLFKKEDLNWKYETGFLENIKSITKEFVDAKQIKVCMIIKLYSVL